MSMGDEERRAQVADNLIFLLQGRLYLEMREADQLAGRLLEMLKRQGLELISYDDIDETPRTPDA